MSRLLHASLMIFVMNVGLGWMSTGRAMIWTNVSVEQAVQMVQSQYPDKVLDIDSVPHQQAYRVKLLSPAGKVHFVWIDVATGQIYTSPPTQP